MKPCYLSLSSTGNVLTDPQDITASVLRFFLGTTGGTSDLYSDYVKSFRLLEQQYGNSPEVLANMVQNELADILSRYLLDISFNVIVKYEMIDSVRYTLTIDIVRFDENKIMYGLINSKRISINSKTHQFDILFTK